MRIENFSILSEYIHIEVGKDEKRESREQEKEGQQSQYEEKEKLLVPTSPISSTSTHM